MKNTWHRNIYLYCTVCKNETKHLQTLNGEVINICTVCGKKEIEGHPNSGELNNREDKETVRVSDKLNRG